MKRTVLMGGREERMTIRDDGDMMAVMMMAMAVSVMAG